MNTLVKVAPIALSLVALSLSAWTFVVSRRRDRRDLFLRLHERLVDPELRTGRKALYGINSVADVKNLEETDPDVYDLLERALAMFDIFGLYARNGYVDKELALQEWGHTYASAYEHSKHYLERRDKKGGPPIWPNLRAFGADSVAWSRERFPASQDSTPAD